MKVSILLLALQVMVSSMAHAQTSNESQQASLAQRVQLIEDRQAIKSLVDTFSNLADTKEIDQQILLFTEDATVTSYAGNEVSSSLKGRKQIGDVFTSFLSNFDIVYHVNGQQTVEINGDRAEGIAYCLVVLIGEAEGKTLRTTMGVRYNDTYQRQGSEWLIAARESHFVWRKVEEVQ